MGRRSKGMWLAVLSAALVVVVGSSVFVSAGPGAQVSNSTYGPPCATADGVGAASADTIDFDPGVFPPAMPATIALDSTLA